MKKLKCKDKKPRLSHFCQDGRCKMEMEYNSISLGEKIKLHTAIKRTLEAHSDVWGVDGKDWYTYMIKEARHNLILECVNAAYYAYRDHLRGRIKRYALIRCYLICEMCEELGL